MSIYKLKGGALYIALIISILIGVMLSIFILIAWFNQKQVLSRIGTEQLRHNLITGLNYAQSSFFMDIDNGKWKKSEYGYDSIKVRARQWGGYFLISVDTKNSHQSQSKCGIFGCSVASDTALMIRDFPRPLSIAGKIRLNGLCYIPKGQFKSTDLEGTSFNPVGDINRFIRNAPYNLPELSKEFLKRLEKSRQTINLKTDSLIGIIDNIDNSFRGKTAIYENSSISLNDNKLKGNIKLIATDKVVIGNQALLSDIFIIAKKVLIKKGFKGIVHILASDSIIIEEDCELEYPSSLIVFNDNEKKVSQMPGIYIDDNCKIMGDIIVTCKLIENKAMLNVGKEVEVFGVVFSSGYASLQGKYFGNVYVDRLMLKTPLALYDNHLLNIELDSRKFSSSLIIPLLFETQNKLKCAKWL